MSPSLEPAILQEWLAPFNLTLESLTELPYSLQANILRFIFPFLLPYEGYDGFEFDEINSGGLNLLAWVVGNKASGKTPPKRLWQVLFDLFLRLGEPGPATYIFSLIWPEPELNRVTYFSQLIKLNLAGKDLEAALQTFQEMQGNFPNRYTTFTSEAEICLFQADLASASSVYSSALEFYPNSRRLFLYLALVAFKQNNLEEAASKLEQLESFYAPDEVRPLKVIQLWQKLGNYDKASRLTETYLLYREKQQSELCRKIAGQGLLPPEQILEPGFDDSEPANPVSTKTGEALAEIAVSPQASEGLPQSAYQVLKEVFGYDEFRPGQEQVIANILAGFDTLAVLPTGAGKSLCYQLPALLLDRPVLVLSPLISLMKDQFDKLPGALKEHTLTINSSLDPAEAARRLQQLSQPGNSVRLVYAAPERLRQTPFIKALCKGGLGLVVVDEAHCVTMWGNDFRPDYLFIRQALRALNTSLLAVTATATPQVTQEITRELGRDFKVVRGSVFRSNLNFSVEKILAKVEKRLARVVELCKSLPGSGIIYTRSREKCEQVAGYLRQHGINARPYHAGMDNIARQRVQDSWTTGQTGVVVATIAFGMGIDKPDVRFIIHFNPATSLENYMQEAGRAGRDGQPASCIMLYSSSDKANLSRWLREENEQLDLEMLREVYRIIARKLGRERRGIISMNEILAGPYSSFPPPGEGLIRVAFSLLEGAGLLERGFDLPLVTRISLPNLEPASPLPYDLVKFYELTALDSYSPVTIDLVSLASRLDISLPELDARLLDWHDAGFLNYQVARREPYLELKDAGNDVRAKLQNLLARRQLEAEKRLDKLDVYLKNFACRQVLLANHFGEKLRHKCGTCDNCTRGESELEMAQNPEPAINHLHHPVKPAPKYTNDEITIIILGCLSLITGGEGQVGRSGLVNLLLGKRSAFGTTANNPYKGKFEAFRVKEAENLVEKLVLTGFIEEHLSETSFYGRPYQAIRLSDKGQLWLDDHKSLLP